MTELDDDIKRLADIGSRVLAGTPIEDFELGEYEIHVVVGYCKQAVDDFLSADSKGSVCGVLPIACIQALLRLLRNQPARPNDENELFDQFACTDASHVLAAAAHFMLGGDGGSNKALEAALVEMLRDHVIRRQQAA